MLESNNWFDQESFSGRHISLDEEKTASMLETIGLETLAELIDQTVPPAIRLAQPMKLPAAKSEWDYLFGPSGLKELAAKNKIFKSYIGLGYYPAITPPVIQRNILENPGWYTQYTPYQAEIAQGRLQALLNFQTMIIDLTGMEVANASLLDESTAAAEAMHLLFNIRKNSSATTFFISDEVFPQTIDVLMGFSAPLGIQIKIGKASDAAHTENIFGVLLQYPGKSGLIEDYTGLSAELQRQNISIAVAADLMSLSLLKPPGEWGADVVVGSTQRFGIPMGFGGPHAAFFATRDAYKRQMPGRIIGVSIDRHGNQALRMTLQTREQHIKRDKATSNICTAQALLAIMASMYAIYHGPEGIRRIARKIHGYTLLLAIGLKELNFDVSEGPYFDTICVDGKDLKAVIHSDAINKEINFRYQDNLIFITLNELTTLEHVNEIISIFGRVKGLGRDLTPKLTHTQLSIQALEFPEKISRKTLFMQHPVFNTIKTEHEMLRYIKALEAKDLSLTHSMIALGSCTMKLNATTEMIPVTWPEFADLHPFAPADQVTGYLLLFTELEEYLCSITGFDAFSLQPNSGAQGEYTGLRVIRAYHHKNNEAHRNVVLIPASAHGTNPASAVIAGFRVIVTACDEKGNINIENLRARAVEHKDNLAALMVTYPSTHGVFEEGILEICQIIHEHGGQVYMDGANMNAQVGLTSPAAIGADVCHLNLHKTFCIPHGGGGPGMGPIGVAKHLAPFLPGHAATGAGGPDSIPAVAAAPWGSAGVLMISHAYICLMGEAGLKKATEHAILNANYLKVRLEPHYPVLYAGNHGFCAHEMILDCRSFKSFGIEVADIAKRLIDYGFHAPTVSFPVAGTLMIEPTESESKEELDRFADALISIRHEITEVEEGIADKTDNVLKNAPHTSMEIGAAQWEHTYSRAKAAYPLSWIKNYKFWSSVARVNETYGDRVFICSCPPVESYQEEVLTH